MLDWTKGRAGVRRGVACALLLVTATACEQPEEASGPTAEEPVSGAFLSVYTVNYPLAWMAERLGGDAVSVSLPVPEGVDPAHWQPLPETVLAYQGADVVLLNGAGYAGWVEFAALSPGRLVDTTAGMEERFVTAGSVTHTHGPGGEHDHGDEASHTWMDPTLASGQAEAVAEALTTRLPAEREAIASRLTALQADLADLDRQLADVLTPLAGRVIYSHPVYQYLDARYALDGVSVTWEPDEDPGETGWRQLAAFVADREGPVMLWEGEPLPGVRARLESEGVMVVVFPTGAVPPASGDYLSLMKANSLRLAGLAADDE